jgi:23S rRNA pseudouridine1911/1915/1917 synthase
MEQTGLLSDSDWFHLTVSESHRTIRLDHYLVQALSGLSRSQINGSIKSGTILVNDAKAKAGHRLKQGDVITGFISERVSGERPKPQHVDFAVLYEDNCLLALAKPPGLVVHPGSGNHDKTLINGLLYEYPEIAGIGDESRPGIVHRLDKDTSGVMLVARKKEVHRYLAKSFKDRQIDKCYLALVHKTPRQSSGRIIASIGRHPMNRQKMTVRETGGRHAATNWIIKEHFDTFSLLKIIIETGRTHQIRVHMAHIGHPVAGDRLYGPQAGNIVFPRQMLHAWKISFNHPQTQERITIEAPLFPDFQLILDEMRKRRC